ncbi:hypothetical protein CHS0354_037200 [Potamilus streckersoni]|uniref:Antistasin-like domain-containing protein n=1 Tax=Potamilus streckersoni TaxID=2493646 RepID=A0AAE0SXH0_9BIVA|nr:hypothetical protein CHS0354_037200 [Potamilus streckersoni]
MASLALPGSRRGSCLLLCGARVNRTCLEGYECKSNGCGSECYMSANYNQPDNCPPFACDLHCPLGYYRDELKCDQCKCDYSILG